MTTAPPRVAEGDVVAVVSPSFGGIGRWPHRTERGVDYLRSLGLRVKLMPHAAQSGSWVSASPQERAADLHSAFLDDEVKVIIAGIGGNHTNQILPYLDYDLIADHPKILQGYSDVTVLQWAIMKHAGLRTFYGPALVSELGEYPQVLDYTDRFLRSAWFGDGPLRFEPASLWTDEFLDWDERADLERPRSMRPGEGWVALCEGVAEGPLVAGCLETVCWHLKGSESWLDLSGCILVLETSEEAPSPAHVDAYLTDLEQLGVFDELSGFVMGRPANYSDEEKRYLWNVVRERTAPSGIPVLANLDCGHTDPMLTLPLGASAHLDTGSLTFEMLEPATTVAQV